MNVTGFSPSTSADCILSGQFAFSPAKLIFRRSWSGFQVITCRVTVGTSFSFSPPPGVFRSHPAITLPASIRPLSSTSPAPDVAVRGCLVGAGADAEALAVGPSAGEVRSLPPAAGTTSPRPDRKGSGPRWFVSVQACCISPFCPSDRRVLSSSISASAIPSTTLSQLRLPCFSGTKA